MYHLVAHGLSCKSSAKPSANICKIKSRLGTKHHTKTHKNVRERSRAAQPFAGLTILAWARIRWDLFFGSSAVSEYDPGGHSARPAHPQHGTSGILRGKGGKAAGCGVVLLVCPARGLPKGNNMQSGKNEEEGKKKARLEARVQGLDSFPPTDTNPSHS